SLFLTLAWQTPGPTYSARPQDAPRKYLIKPMSLGTNTEIRARATRNLQVQVTDENDHPLPDVPLLFLLAGLAAGRGGNLGTFVTQTAGNAAGAGAGGTVGSAASQASAGAGQAVGNAVSQISTRVLTDQYGIANVNFTASDAVGQSLRLQIRVEGTNVVWEGELNVVRAEAVTQASQSDVPPADAASLPVLEAEEKACIALINEFRAAHQQPPVKVSIKLTRAAQWLSADNAQHNPNDPEHTDSLGRDVGKRLRHFGYEADIIKENIVVGAESASAAMQVWLASGFHIRNLLNDEVVVVGAGRVCKKGAKTNCHWTVILGNSPDQLIP
ncbi:MAG: CAP domain-containing protein, partial [Blastocatellia bacterium]